MGEEITDAERLRRCEEQRVVMKNELKARRKQMEQLRQESAVIDQKIEEIETRIAALNHQGLKKKPEDTVQVSDNTFEITLPNGAHLLKRIAENDSEQR